MLLVAVSSALAAQATQTRLQKLVGIAAEDGIVALDGNKLSVFSTANIRIQDPTSLQWKLAEKKSGAVSVGVDGTRWQELPSPLPISTAYSFAFCDPLNQVDVRASNNRIRSVLPAGAKVKSLVRVSDDLSLVVYSTSTNTVRYDVRVGVVQNRASNGYSLINDDLATDAGNFCGVQQANGDVFLVFADEPSGSSDFSAVYIYALVGREHHQR
jgi:hypothetical protein